METEKHVETVKSALADGVRCIVVAGAAGTGKTTLIRDIIPVLSSLRYVVKLLAPTGRAAKMIQNRTGHPASTIHSAIFRIDDKPVAGADENGDLRWVFPLKVERPARTAFIVDESSMVGMARHNDGVLQFGTGSLLRDLLAYSGIGRPESDNLVFFVGDSFQLPPVGEKESNPPALDETFLANLTGAMVRTIRLGKVYRQDEGSGILEEANRLRSAIAYHCYGAFRCGAHDDFRIVDETRFDQLYRPDENLNDKVVIAYTNARVWEFNCRVRGLLNRAEAFPSAGERLLSLRNTQVPDGDGGEAVFMNGDMLQALEVDAGRIVRLTGFCRPKNSDETLTFEFTFVRMKLCWMYEDDHDDAEAWVNVTPIVSESYRANPEYASVALYVAVSNEIRRRFKLGHSAADDEKVREHLKNSLLYHAPIVTYGYAITGHKAQGGEWKEVWIDCRYAHNKMTEGYFRWMYTAVTRARKCVFALSPTAFDDIAEALARAIDRMPTASVAPASGGAALNLREILAKNGYVVAETTKKPYVARFVLARSGDPFADAGWLELNYNGKDMISHVKLQSQCASDEFGKDVSSLKGRNINTVLHEDGMDRCWPEPEVWIVDGHAHIRDRLFAVAANAGMRVLFLKSLTANQLRLGLSSDIGDGYLDFYVDSKGRVTEIGSATVSRTGLERFREGLVRD